MWRECTSKRDDKDALLIIYGLPSIGPWIFRDVPRAGPDKANDQRDVPRRLTDDEKGRGGTS